jgi:hypothetical protein
VDAASRLKLAFTVDVALRLAVEGREGAAYAAVAGYLPGIHRMPTGTIAVENFAAPAARSVVTIGLTTGSPQAIVAGTLPIDTK